MAITLADFTKIWASTSPLTPYSFSDSNYQEGWNFIGATPPARQMWDSIQKNNDEKLKYIVDNFLPLSGGTLTGAVVGNPLTLTADDGNGNSADLVLNPNGSATWNGKEVERVHAYSISASTGYVRYTSGLQMVWGSIDVGTTAVDETYAVAFSAYPSVVATANSNATIYISANNSTRFTVRTASGTTTVRYIAIGKWQ